jgi:hypothetical protein
MALTLRTLPSLLTDCVLVGHAQRADLVFTPRQYFDMCSHMMNDNPPNFFLNIYRDKAGKPRLTACGWTWDCISSVTPRGVFFTR